MRKLRNVSFGTAGAAKAIKAKTALINAKTSKRRRKFSSKNTLIKLGKDMKSWKLITQTKKKTNERKKKTPIKKNAKTKDAKDKILKSCFLMSKSKAF